MRFTEAAGSAAFSALNMQRYLKEHQWDFMPEDTKA